MNKVSGIYYIQNIENGKIYIGSAVDIRKRWREHKHHLYKNNHVNKHLQSVWNKDGEDIFIFGIMEIVKDKYSLLDREQYWIDKFEATDNNFGYNKAPVAGSFLGCHHTEETKERLRKVGFPKGHTPWNKGKKMEGEYKENFLIAMRSDKKKASYRKNGEFKHTKETRKKISEIQKGKKATETTRKKMSEAHKGKPMPKGHRENCIKAWAKRKTKEE